MADKDEEKRDQEYDQMDDYKRIRNMYFGISNLIDEIGTLRFYQGCQTLLLFLILIKVSS